MTARFYQTYDPLEIKENKNEENFFKKNFEENGAQKAHFQMARFMTVSEDRWQADGATGSRVRNFGVCLPGWFN